MQITLTSITVEDQERALAFYTKILGFEKVHDIPMGEFRWLTVLFEDTCGNLINLVQPAA